MSAEQGTSGIPAARPVETRVHREDPHPAPDAPRWYRDGDRWLRAGMAGALVLAWTLTDVGPAALVAMVVVAADTTVRTRRTGVRWSTALELVGYVVLVVMTLTLTRAASELTAVELAAQLVVGALVGVGIVALVAAVRRRRAARVGPPTAA